MVAEGRVDAVVCDWSGGVVPMWAAGSTGLKPRETSFTVTTSDIVNVYAFRRVFFLFK